MEFFFWGWLGLTTEPHSVAHRGPGGPGLASSFGLGAEALALGDATKSVAPPHVDAKTFTAPHCPVCGRRQCPAQVPAEQGRAKG